MPRYICHHNGKFFEWSTIVDAPVTKAMTAANFQEHYAFKYGRCSLDRLEQRMSRAVETGSSVGESLEEVFACNRAGPNGTELDFEQVLASVGISSNEKEQHQ